MTPFKITPATHIISPHARPHPSSKPSSPHEKKTPRFGARRIVDLFELSAGKGAPHRIPATTACYASVRASTRAKPACAKLKPPANRSLVSKWTPNISTISSITGPRCRPKGCPVSNTRPRRKWRIAAQQSAAVSGGAPTDPALDQGGQIQRAGERFARSTASGDGRAEQADGCDHGQPHGAINAHERGARLLWCKTPQKGQGARSGLPPWASARAANHCGQRARPRRSRSTGRRGPSDDL